MLMKQILKYLKRFDYILIITAVLLSFTPTIITTFFLSQQSKNQLIALVKINGDVVDRFVLSDSTPNQEFYYTPNDNQYNIVEIDRHRIRIKEDNSPDQIGVRTGWISQYGQVAVCLPHQLMIEITGEATPDANEMILPLN
ncbi:NusG domain II-containing protein [Carnobacteriaceae bacterium zg-ZUI252]|nr:NusG domain II-containing protein [Carnobacteriaceae bacterium zg-ZUI252]MBS4770298.1 NusG domain II-containing protein [Carnobacteriaceae bacterium zg-ZUI240]QTU82416.1 NusG domain II-containing protein [Carnobacteriaceae bacterium zg-C25]